MSFYEDAKGAAALGASSGGGGGTDNYEELNNLPEINGVTLAGNKSSSDLGLQGVIEDLSDIRSGASAGATAVQTIKIGNETQTKTSGVVALPAYPTTLPASDTTSTYSATGTAPVNGTAVASAISGKQDTISDLSDIRSGAGAGATAVQTIQINGVAQTKTSGTVNLPAYPTALPASDTVSTYSATGTAPVNGTAVAAALGTLDVASAGGSGKYISAISETDGKISATAETMDTVPTASSTKACTSGGVHTPLAEIIDNGAKNAINLYGYTYYASDVGVHVDANASMELECSGTCLRDIYVAIKDIQLTAGKYVISGIQGSTTANTYFLSIEGRNGATGAAIDYGAGAEFTAGGGEYRVYLRIKQGIDMDNIKIKPMICTSADWAISHGYAPYALSNPVLSPAVIKSVNEGAKNKMPYTLASLKSINTAGTWNGNEYEHNGVKFTVNPDLSITANGTISGQSANALLYTYSRQI